MFLFTLLLCLPLFPLFESKQFLAEMKSGKHEILETNNGNGTGNGAQQELSFHKNMAVKNIRKPDHSKVENAESTTESHLTTTDEISIGEDYFPHKSALSCRKFFPKTDKTRKEVFDGLP